MADQPLKSPLKWAGGKRWLVSLLKRLWADDNDRRWVEPFGGGLSVAFGLCPKKALLNDINPHSISFFKQLQKGLVIKIPLVNRAEVYYQYRARFNELIEIGRQESVEAASLFYYLNRTGFNGLCRFNQKGAFNVPFGLHKNIRYQYDFLGYRKGLKRWQLKNQDFTKLKLKKDDFIYADPPYDVPFTQYSRQGFSWNDQVRLVEWLLKHDGPMILSNQATDRIIDLYQKSGFYVGTLKAPRSISCRSERKPETEVLAFRGIDPEKMQKKALPELERRG